jgi:hypothetical protein
MAVGFFVGAAFAAEPETPKAAQLRIGILKSPWCTLSILTEHYALGAYHCIGDHPGSWFTASIPDGKSLGEIKVVRVRGDLMLVRFEKSTGVRNEIGRRPRGLETKVEIHGLPGGKLVVSKAMWTHASTLDWTGEEVFTLEAEGGSVIGGMSGAPVVLQGRIIGVAVAKNLAGDKGWAIAVEKIAEEWAEDFK